MNISISDTFDNISFTSSGHLVNKENLLCNSSTSNHFKTNFNNLNNKEITDLQCLKISFDDSAFLNDSFSFTKPTEHENAKQDIPTENIQEINKPIPSNKCNGVKTNQAELNKTPCKAMPTILKDKQILPINSPKTNNVKSVKILSDKEPLTPKSNNILVRVTSRPSITPKSINNLSNIHSDAPLSGKKPSFASTPNTTPKSIRQHKKPTEPERFQFSQSENNKLSILGLPPEILQKYECRNVTRIFPWQLECLSCKGVLDEGKNLVYSAPTSAGKTLVAEIIAVKTVLERNKKVIFILPFVSVVREKMFYFQDIFGSSGIRVEGFMGSYNPPGGFKNVSVAICTIEKANSLVNRLLEEGKLGDIGAVIVDELHMIGDSSRGYLLELLLTKLNYISQKDSDVKIQIVGMSATLPNLSLLGAWLNAALYVTNFRPIPLNEQCLVSGDVFNSDFMLTRRLVPIPELETDTDNVLQLCLEMLLQACSVLVFCPSKNWCESLAVQIATAFFKIGSSQTSLGEQLRNRLPVDPIKECLEQLKRSPTGLDDVLKKTVSFGVAFHHAGLTMDERDIIEASFRTGGLRVLVATSTLSSGVNLPARRVIVRSPTFFGKPIDVLSYKQMVGRAGRMGKDTAGESILICQKKDIGIAKDLISGQLEPIRSCLEGARLKRALLEIIASDVASTPDEIDTFSRCTLLNQEGASVGNPITDALEFLIKYQFVRLQVSNDADGCNNYYVATSLAKACLNSSMPPEEGLILFAELEKARQCFVLETDLHLIYLVTPYSAQINSIDWMQFLDMWEKLPASMKRVGELVGIKISFIINCSRGKVPNNASKVAVHGRFYTALALQDLVNEIPLIEVAEKFRCNRGALQTLQQNAAAFAGRVTTFSRQLGWSSVELLIGQFQDRLQFGVSRELLDLMRLPILNGQRARVLFNAGIESLVDLAGCNVLELENVLHRAKPFESKEREGESKHDAQKRNNLRTIFITGKSGLTELEAAQLMIEDARKYLQYEIGLTDAKWSQVDKDQSETDKCSESPETNNESMGDHKELDQTTTKDASFKEALQLETKADLSETKANSSGINRVNNFKKPSTVVNVSIDNLGNGTLDSFEVSGSPRSMKIGLSELNVSNLPDDRDFDLTSLRLSSSSSTKSPSPVTSPRYNLRSQMKVQKDVSAESLFNDSFNDQMVLMKNSQTNGKITLQDIQEEVTKKTDVSALNDSFTAHLALLKNTQTINKVPSQNQHSGESNPPESDSFLTKAFMESFNESLSLKVDSGTNSDLNKTQRCLDVNEQEQKGEEDDNHRQGVKRNSAKIYSSNSESDCSVISDDDIFISPVPPKMSRRSSVKPRNDVGDDRELNIEIINICDNVLLFTKFMEELKNHDIISLSIGCEYYEEEKQIIGIRKSIKPRPQFTHKTSKIHGISIYWPSMNQSHYTTYYIEMEKLIEECKTCDVGDPLKVFEEEVFKKTLRMFDGKEQLKLLSLCLQWKVNPLKIEDPRIAEWLLDPEVPERSLRQMVKAYLPDYEELLGLAEKQHQKGVASLESIANWFLVESMKKRLLTEDSKFLSCYDNEMHVILILTKMELNGMPVNVKSLQSFADSLKSYLQALENEAFNIAGRRFSFTSSAAVSKVLNMRSKGKRKVSTNKAALVQYDHPLADIIMQWRKISATLTKMVYPLLRNVESGRIRGTCITHNSTGRVSMHEPNLQNVPRDFQFVDPKTSKAHDICIRGAFGVATECSALEKMTIVSADYCQLELRLLAHLSEDSTLGRIMRSDGDIFKAIAAKWRRITESEVDDALRQQTKQICYGIIYGIGNKSLADQMNITEDEALEFTETFHQNYPGIRRFIKETIAKCEDDGYVETLLGRRRYLPMINSTNQVEKSKAERQAVNTTVQGSAADIAKQAMILVDKKACEKFRNSRNGPKLILQLHDELLYEVPSKYESVFARILKKCMQESVKLTVPLPVKVQSGKSWGSLVLK